ncbi:MAG: shikimate kinase [Alphaproteobacteria bacterium]|jgi:shikimate kinase|nr:shikimate kinase [Alphaproteobacteria bacterium]MDP6567079.1 shikimate kinase [Alphaproteobacteria bacterium]MDP6811574.1 shikimate kinase [Alphaproteobacteria bacterium]
MSSPAIPKQDRSIVLVGLMGAGKSSIGRRLAKRLKLPFVDADQEIEAAAGCTIEDIFRLHGEAAFRDGERRVISRLLDGPARVMATGGGAFMDPQTRARIAEQGLSIWLKADLEVLLERVLRRDNRPLLKQGDPKRILEDLMARRYPVYAEADLVIESSTGPHEDVVERIVDALVARAARADGAAAGQGA